MRVIGTIKNAGLNLGHKVMQNREFSIAIVLLFVSRWLLSNQSSYWLDEHYSVYAYGVKYGNVIEALYNLARTSVHPPLYQGILYEWMQVFGTSETATRTLSNIFITLATVMVFVLIKDFLPRWFAILVAVTFGLAPTAIIFGLETRSYAMTIFLAMGALVALKSYLALDLNANKQQRRPKFWWLTLSIAGLMLTHYYNMFFVGAVGAFVLTQLLLRAKPSVEFKQRIRSAVWAIIAGVLIFLAIWGVVFVYQFFKKKSRFATDEVSLDLVEFYRQMLVGSNLDETLWLADLVVLFAALIGIWILVRALRNRKVELAGEEALLATLTFAVFLPILLSYAVFAILGVERAMIRYYLYSSALLPVVIMVALFWLVKRVAKRRQQLTQVLVALAFIFALILPQSFVASTYPKTDWRSIIHTAVVWSEDNYPSGLHIYETSFKPMAMSTYYLGQNHYQPLSLQPIQKIKDDVAKVEDYSPSKLGITNDQPLMIFYLVHAADKFSVLTEALNKYYFVSYSYLNDTKQGFVVYLPKPFIAN